MTIETPAELAPALRRADPETLPTIAQTISSPEFQEWWWVCAPSTRDADLEHIRTWAARLDGAPSSDAEAALADRHPDLPARLRCYALLSYFCPSLAFPFNAHWIDSPAQFVERTQGGHNRNLGIDLLRSGWLRLWLANRQVASPSEIERVFDTADLSDYARLQEALYLIDPSLTPPAPVCEPTTIDFGRVSADQPQTKSVRIDQTGGDYLYGSVTLADNDRGVSVEPIRIEGMPARIEVTADSTGLAPASRQNTTLHVQTRGGSQDIRITFRVKRPKNNPAAGPQAQVSKPYQRKPGNQGKQSFNFARFALFILFAAVLVPVCVLVTGLIGGITLIFPGIIVIVLLQGSGVDLSGIDVEDVWLNTCMTVGALIGLLVAYALACDQTNSRR